MYRYVIYIMFVGDEIAFFLFFCLLVQRNGPAPRITSVEDTFSFAKLQAVFRHRALTTCAQTSADFEALIESGKTWGEAFNASAVSLVEMSRAHCWLLMLDLFVDSVKKYIHLCVRFCIYCRIIYIIMNTLVSHKQRGDIFFFF